MLLLEEMEGEIKLVLSNPVNAALLVHVDINLQLEGNGAQWMDDLGVTRLAFDLSGGQMAGSSVAKTFIVVPEPGTAASLALAAGAGMLRRRRRA